VGFKPSYERVSRAGLVPLAPSLDHVGLFARDVATIARAAAVVASGFEAKPAARGPLRLAVVVGPYLESLSPAGVEHFARVRERLERAGHELVEVAAMADFADVAERHRRLVAFDAARVHAAWFDEYGDLYAPKTVELLRRGRGLSAEEAARDRAGRLALREELETALAGADLFLSPPAVGPAPRGLDSTGDPVMNLPWTHAGLPTLVVPAGASAARFGEPMPMGAQLAARFGDDEALLALGDSLAEDLRELAGTSEEAAP
jgi:Asp-tRNA(Asn)/Glu-tRNA(Gln) amidotransferase A subunit family amidase